MKIDNCPVSHDERRRMIATAAYFRFIREGDTNRDPLADWLAAEAEVEKSLQAECGSALPFSKKHRNPRAGLLDAVTGWMYRVTTRSSSGAHRRIG